MGFYTLLCKVHLTKLEVFTSIFVVDNIFEMKWNERMKNWNDNTCQKLKFL